jgi:adenylate kinase
MEPKSPRFRRLVITNVPGADWDESSNAGFVERLQHRLQEEVGIRPEVSSIREILYRFASEENLQLDPIRIHRSPDEKVRLLRRLAFQDVERRLENGAEHENRITVVKTRATSYSSHGKEESLALRYLQGIKPDLLAVVIDDPVSIHSRIPKREDTRKYGRLGLDDIVWWQEAEVSEMQRLARELRCRLFVIPRQQVNALVDLIVSDKEPAYASYAMTKATPDQTAKVKAFVAELKKHFVVFDPACMGTAHVQLRMTDSESAAYRQNVVKRDREWFIGINSNYVVVYLPAQMPAHGSQSELVAASEQGKAVWVVLEPEYSDERGRLTPFLDGLVDHVFISSDELNYFLALSAEHRQVYGFIADAMWHFKWRWELTPLAEAAAACSSRDDLESQITAKFLEEVLIGYGRDSGRQMLPALEEHQVTAMAEACWRFNQPLWESKAFRDDHLELFPEPEAEPLAARSSQIADGTNAPGGGEHVLPASGRAPVPEAARLTDDETFRALFGKHAGRKAGDILFRAIQDFLAGSELGSLENNLPFLRFIVRTLGGDGPGRSRSVTAEQVREWFREFNAEKGSGSEEQ